MPSIERLYRTADVRMSDGDVEETRRIVFQISDDTKDRHGTVMNMDNWDLDSFNRNGIVGFQHDVYGGGMCKGPDPDSIIGKGRAWIEEETVRDENGSPVVKKVLMGEVEFEPEDINPLAEKIFRKVLNGTLRATSVGIRPIKNEDGERGRKGRLNEDGEVVDKDTFYFFGQELLEFSIVSIPSNPNALKRDLRNQTANALHFLKRELGDGFTFGDIEEMKVKDVIKLMEKPEKLDKKDIEIGDPNSRVEDAAKKAVDLLIDRGYIKIKREEPSPEEGVSEHKLKHESRKRRLSIKKSKVNSL